LSIKNNDDGQEGMLKHYLDVFSCTPSNNTTPDIWMCSSLFISILQGKDTTNNKRRNSLSHTIQSGQPHK
jgi:hypothetical protein